LKVPPSVKGVVIDKKLFSRAVKDKNNKLDEKAVIAKIDDEQAKALVELKAKLVDKLFILGKWKNFSGCNG
jgi:DNA-directed RNA polymerase subunit beta